MSYTVGNYAVDRLKAWNIRRIYGYPGDGINGLLGALHQADGNPQFIQTRHEELAAFCACAHAKSTGELGVCLATSGPGAIHLLNGLYDAKLDHQPVLAIVGQQRRTSLGSFYQQEVDLTTLFKDVAQYVQQASVPAQVRNLIDNACRIALAYRTVTAVILPNDLQEQPAEPEPARRHGTSFTGVGWSEPDVVPRDTDLDRAADVLNNCSKVAILVGAGALGASDEVENVADLLGTGVAKALLGKAALADDLPYVTGSIGLLGTRPSWDMMRSCDGLLMVGTSFPYSEFLPKPGQARGVQIDIKPQSLSLRYPCEVNLCGDARLTLRELIPRLNYKPGRAWRQQIESNIVEWWKLLEERAMIPASPVNPQRVFWELSPLLPDRCILTADSGSGTNWWARDLKIRKGMLASLSGNLATMGPGCPYALAAKLAFPDRPVVATVGDGAMQMNGCNVLITLSRLWREWRNPQFVVVVLNNHDLNQVTWEQRIMNGEAKYPASQDLPDFPFARYAEDLGLRGIRIERPEQIRPAIEEAFGSDRPVVLDCLTDPEVPPLPPHITFQQAVNFWASVFKGDPNRWHMMGQSFADLSKTYVGV